MNVKEVKDLLSEYNKINVQSYCDYIEKLKNKKDRNKKLKYPWVSNVSISKFASIFKKVAQDGIFIDGDSVTLQYISGELTANYNYQAYKNKLISKYPETKFDLQLVCKDDTFSITKVDGNISYQHVISNPFDTKREIVGAYCFISNSRGNFVETINKDDIDKIRSTAKTQAIWDDWYSEMVLKSVLKRACKRHFKDVTVNMDNIDNENSDVSEDLLSFEVKKEIESCINILDLKKLHDKYKYEYSNSPTFVRLFSERKAEIQEDENYKQPVGETGLKRAIEAIKTGRMTKDGFLKMYILDENQTKTLENQLNNE